MKLKVFEAFAGYGSQAMALNRLRENYPQFDYEVVGISEIDKYALRAYQAVHGHCPNYGDISKIDWNTVPDFDLLTYSFPCTDISNAGQQKGLSKASGTRSSLLWECQRAIEIKRPKYLLMENVSALLSQKFFPLYKEWRNVLGTLGYSSFTQILNAKDFGIPQNRERVFMVSILGDCQYHFPSTFPLQLRLKDILETEVDDKYYLSNSAIKSFISHTKKHQEKGNGFKFQPNDGEGIANTVLTRNGSRAYDNYIMVKIKFATGGGEPKIVEPLCSVHPLSRAKEFDPNTSIKPISPALRASDYKAPHCVYEPLHIRESTAKGYVEAYDGESVNWYRIRKLTPRECFRLMDVSEPDIDKLLSAGISNSQLYKLAGNSIVVSCLYHIFRKMFIEPQNENQQLTLF